MSRARALVLAALTALFVITFFSLVEGAAVRDGSKAPDAKGAVQQVLMPESEASNFFKRRSRRSDRYYEFQAEQRVKMAANEQRREYNEEQRNEYENYVEEDRDEVSERSRETSEQLREFHYDGLHPRYHWFH